MGDDGVSQCELSEGAIGPPIAGGISTAPRLQAVDTTNGIPQLKEKPDEQMPPCLLPPAMDHGTAPADYWRHMRPRPAGAKITGIPYTPWSGLSATVLRRNLGNNATFGFIVTDEGVILIDAGGGYGVQSQSSPPLPRSRRSR